MALIQLNASKDQIRLNQILLHIGAISSISSSLLIWSISPFITDKPIWRYLSLGYTIIGSSFGLVCSRKLEKNYSLYQALEKAETDEFLHRIASAQYAQQQHWERLAIQGDVTGDSGDFTDSHQLAKVTDVTESMSPTPETVEKVLSLKKEGHNQAKIISEVWGLKKNGSNPNWCAARDSYNQIIKEYE